MNTLSLTLAWLCAVVPGLPQTTEKSTNDLMFVARFEAPTVRSGMPVVLLVSSHNQTEKTYVTFLRHPAWDYEFGVRNDKGEDVPLSSGGQHLLRLRDSRRNIRKAIAPGETFEERIDIAVLYEMKTVGKYTITAKRRFYNAIGLEKGLLKAESLDRVTNAASVEIIQ